MLYKLPSVERLLARGRDAVDTHALGLTMLRRVFGAAPESPGLRADFAALNAALTAAVERGFVNNAAATAALARAHVARCVARLLSFEPDGRRQRRRERAARVVVVAADLDALLRDLGACIAIPLLYGADFLDRNPRLLADFWSFDNHAFPLLLAGAPAWLPVPSFREGLRARARLHDALAAFYRRLQQSERGEPVDFGADMTDVSAVARQRNAAFDRFAVPVRDRGELELGALWGQNANTQPLIFWFVLYIYSTPGLVDALRAEVDPCLAPAAPSGPSTSPTSSTPSSSAAAAAADPRLVDHIDYAALGTACPLLKSALLETFRLANQPMSIRYVARPLTVPDGEHSHHLRAGTWISAPHAGIQRDGAVFPDPDRFVPDRFLERDGRTGRPVARYGQLRPWGAGICKGRTFAEKEILAVVACFVAMWDMDPAGGGPWTLPGFSPGTGVMRPRESVRVVIKRRRWPPGPDGHGLPGGSSGPSSTVPSDSCPGGMQDKGKGGRHGCRREIVTRDSR